MLYPIIDVSLCTTRSIDPVNLAESYLRGGARILQVRMKEGTDAAFLALADTLVACTHAAGARLIVNDRTDIAVLSRADGVHVGQDDLPPAYARALLGPSPIIGVSTHTAEQVDEALASDASYLAVGPIFTTSTKDTGYDARGLNLVKYAARRGKPIVAIGGITLDRAAAVADAGADAVAVISDLLTGNAPESRVRSFLAALPARSFRV